VQVREGLCPSLKSLSPLQITRGAYEGAKPLIKTTSPSIFKEELIGRVFKRGVSPSSETNPPLLEKERGIGCN